MRSVYLALLFLGTVTAQQKYRLCAPDTVTENTCYALQRGESEVSCVRVLDSADCAIKINRGEADFGVFNAEEALVAYNFYPSDTQVIAEVKYRERAQELWEFRTVAVIRSNFTPGSFDDLKQGGLCHPGYSNAQLWNDLILKNFEQRVYKNECNTNLTAAENEAVNLRNYFGTACRPGKWVSNSKYDAALKQKYPELCAACDNTTACQYTRTEHHGHVGALDCLVNGKGGVAYVALDFVYQYFKINDTILSNTDLNPETLEQSLREYRFLCPDGLQEPIYKANPCTWIRQPWPTITVKNEHVTVLQEKLKTWLTPDPSRGQSWTVALNTILQRDTVVEFVPTPQTLGNYLSSGRELVPTTKACGNPIRWCTIGSIETNKCNWVARAAVTHGIQPNISCNEANNTFDCFHNIANNTADIITIDSNYGLVARNVFNLTTIVYSETESISNSVVLAVVRNGSSYNVSSFASLKSRTACFPEYGGIAWLSFINAARQNKVLSDSCDYESQVAGLLSGACTPGFGDRNRQNGALGSTTSSLCSICPVEVNKATCSANSSNIYYGDKGALECLNSGAGDVAFIEPLNLADYITYGVIDPSKYRVLCKNGSLASYTGFKVDNLCALSVTIDSEVVGRRSMSDVDSTNTVMALLKVENWLGYRANSLRPIHVFGTFNDTKDVLFKDTSSGLETTESTLRAVIAYKELFAHLESCSGSGSVAVLASLSTVLLLLLVHYL